MFREILGLPAHALLVHAAVVLLPLLVLAAVGYAVVPPLRARLGWVAAGLAVAAPVAAWMATESGEQLRDVLVAKGYPAEILDPVAQHQAYGERAFWFSLALGVATLTLLALTGDRARARNLSGWPAMALAVVVVLLAVGTAYYSFLAGDSGARVVWEGVL